MNKLLGVMYYVRKILDLVNHVHSDETSWCGKNFRVVFDILFGDKFLDLCWTFGLLAKFWLELDILYGDKILDLSLTFYMVFECHVEIFINGPIKVVNWLYQVRSRLCFMVNFWSGRLHIWNKLFTWSFVMYLLLNSIYFFVR